MIWHNHDCNSDEQTRKYSDKIIALSICNCIYDILQQNRKGENYLQLLDSFIVKSGTIVIAANIYNN